ncbi:MAG: alpha/beta hydrolase [Candidatus Caldarchaeum sp.]|nr:alpha/beta hydrolase [Candidatus Caldarchaeum sp.]MCX8201978.1 alpha/beta hydrolase [Candidatus Caldarchaeum sp.]MDW8063732.1 alpha/beta hydrolase [Candidatus Caldarchaeum sp.]MDW8435848.1 alpha/beta hydrolase [Candidatus Caldarchaeum sp.]
MIVKRGFIETPEGQIHFRSCGAGDPVIMLHQTPRSSAEFEYVLPIVGEKFQAIAVDSVGFGDSYRFVGEITIERIARGVSDFLDAVNLKKIHLVGHHTGAVVAVEIASTQPERVKTLVLSGCPYIDEQERQRRKGKEVVDTFHSSMDGSHLIELWRGRQSFYPANRPDLLDRFIIDALKAGKNAAEGHIAVGKYEMEKKINLIKCPTLIIAPKADPFAMPFVSKLRNQITNSRVVEIEGATVALPEQLPDEFAKVVMDFLDTVG